MKLILALLSLFLLSCKANDRYLSSVPNYFEGVVMYEFEYELKDDRFTESQLKENIGARMEMLFKNGNYLRRYFSSSGLLLKEIYLNLEENKSFSKNIGNDTIYWININRNDSKTIFSQIKDSVIMNHPTVGLKTKTTVTGPGFGDNSFEVTGEIYFSKEFKVNPIWYKNYLEGNFYEQVKIGRGIQLLYIFDGPFWKKRTIAVSIDPKKVKNEEILFRPPNNSILKEI